jgi:3-keto-disaccharide hydrolase
MNIFDLSMSRLVSSLLGVALTLLAGGSVLSGTQAQTISLESLDHMKLVNVKAETTTFKGRKALQVRDAAVAGTGDEGRLVILQKTDFQDGIIEVDLTGEPGPGAGEGARGFVGIAFRVAPDQSRFECIYLRPTNGRADDQVRRNHSVQYISIPGFPWPLMRKEFPEKYETYVDLLPGEWTKVKIEVRGEKARLYVNGVEQPTFLVNDLKQKVTKGAVALWVGTGTVAHFSNLRVSP